MKIIVYHGYAGCETGCCGHVVQLGDDDRMFEFAHQDEDKESPLEFAQRLVRDTYGAEHVADLDWANCRIERYGHL